MATIFDLFEVTDISANTTYSAANGNLFGIVDNATSTDLDDGEFDVHDVITIGGVAYTIDRIQEPASSGRFTLGNWNQIPFDPGSESNLQVVFLTVSSGGTARHFIIPNDSYGDMNVQEIRTGNLTDVAGSDAAVISITNNTMNIVCFVAGARIETPQGEVPVEEIRIGDLVCTRDNGPQPVRAVLVRVLDFSVAPERLKPILFHKNSLGPGRPSSGLCVSPQHRMLVVDAMGNAVLVPAKALTRRRGIRVMQRIEQVTYIHLVFARHEIIRANGALTESFYPGVMALKAIPVRCRDEIRDIFDAGAADQNPVPLLSAAPVLRFQEAKRNAHTYC